MLRPSTAPRWKIAISCLARPLLPAANAVRERNDGAKPRLTKANAPFFRKIRRETMSSPLEIRTPEDHRRRLGRGGNDTFQPAFGQRHREIHAAHKRARVYPRVCRVLVTGRRLTLIQRHSQLLHLPDEG